MKVFIADFSADARRLFAENMKRFGASDVFEAANGEDAVQEILRTDPDVAFIDAWLPKLDGLGVIHSVRRMGGRFQTRPQFVFINYEGTANLFSEASRAGASYCVSKPFDYRELWKISDMLTSRTAGAAENTATVQGECMPITVRGELHDSSLRTPVMNYKDNPTSLVLGAGGYTEMTYADPQERRMIPILLITLRRCCIRPLQSSIRPHPPVWNVRSVMRSRSRGTGETWMSSMNISVIPFRTTAESRQTPSSLP